MSLANYQHVSRFKYQVQGKTFSSINGVHATKLTSLTSNNVRRRWWGFATRPGHLTIFQYVKVARWVILLR